MGRKQSLTGEKQLYPQNVTVWCAGSVIGPYFFQNSTGVTVNRERYWCMLTNFLWTQLYDLDVVLCGSRRMVPVDTAAKTIDLFRMRFGYYIISRSCDFASLGFFLWGYLKLLVFVNNPTIEQSWSKHNPWNSSNTTGYVGTSYEKLDPLYRQLQVIKRGKFKWCFVKKINGIKYLFSKYLINIFLT